MKVVFLTFFQSAASHRVRRASLVCCRALEPANEEGEKKGESADQYPARPCISVIL